MAALQQQQQQKPHYFSEDSLSSFNSKTNKNKENTYLTIDNNGGGGGSDKTKTLKIQENDKDDHDTLSAFISESLMYDPKLKRRGAAENYEKPLSQREGWWRVTIKETPLPGAYETRKYSFLSDLLKKPGTYRFKGDGRKLNPTPQIGKGEYLMPGAYNFEDLTTRLTKTNTTYGFRAPERDEYIKKTILGSHDKDIDVSPNAYHTEKYNQIEAEVEPVCHGAFRSRTKRKVFKPREGPPPGSYESSTTRSTIAVSSCFRSKTARFGKTQTITPGPGAYWPLTNWPVSKDVEKLGEKGVFFTPSFKTVE